MGKSPRGETIGAHVSHEIITEIVARGTALSLKKGTYAAKILEWWFEQGCPPVTAADRAMQDLKNAERLSHPTKKKTG